MNKKINEIIEDIKRMCPSESDVNKGRPDVQLTYLLSKLAELLFFFGEETGKLNKRIVWLTLVMAILTAVLLFMSFFEFPKISLSRYHNADQSYQHTKQNQTNQPNKDHR